MSASLRKPQLRADEGQAATGSASDVLDLFPPYEDSDLQPLLANLFDFDENSVTTYLSPSTSTSTSAPSHLPIPHDLHNSYDPPNPLDLDVGLDIGLDLDWAALSQNRPHEPSQGWQAAPFDFADQSVVFPSTYNRNTLPEPLFQGAQSSGQRSLYTVEDSVFPLAQCENVLGYGGNYAGTTNDVGQDIPRPLADPQVRVTETRQHDHPSASTSTSGGQPRAKATKPGKLYGPKRPPILMTTYNKTSKRKPVKGPSGIVQGAFHVFGTKQTQRSSSIQLANAKLTGKSKTKACTRCSKIKKSCVWPESIYLPCNNCRKADPLVHTIPCIRVLIPEITLFRLGPPVDNPNHPLNFFKHRKDLWTINDGVQDVDSRTLKLTQDMGFVLKVKVSPFAPIPGDKTAYEWVSAEGPKKMEMPKYHISNIEEAKTQMTKYVMDSHFGYLDNLLDSSNEILMDTFSMAIRCKKPLVQAALRLWSTTRLTERAWRICGQETLGFEPPLDNSNPWKGTIPVNPIMDQQLDQIVIQHTLIPLRKDVLADLHKKLESRKTAKKHWLEIFLTIFVLLSNAETQLLMERQFALRYGMSGRYGPYGKYKDAEDQFHAARTMLSYYHNVCQGSRPLSVSRKELMAELEVYEVDYVIQLRDKVVQKEQALKRLRHEHQYERDLYWCHQMFFDQWEPGLGHIEELPSASDAG